MSTLIARAVLAEAQKLVVRHQTYASNLADALNRIRRRGMNPPSKDVKVPSYWKSDEGFDPYHVRARSEQIGNAIAKAIRRNTYRPRPAVTYTVPKSDGTERSVCVFQVADNAVSRLIFKSILAKNARQLSARCYSYRVDVTAHDAVTHVAAEFRNHPRLFLAEFDFSKYFDHITHGHLLRLLSDRRFYITKQERAIVEAFMTAPTAPVSTYPLGGKQRSQGIPQGTSISLFLANLAGLPLDQRLERIGVGFARYAADTLIWSNDYSKVCRAVDVLNEACDEMGVAINLKKSDGVSILATEQREAEFRSKSSISYVGYEIGRHGIGVKAATAERAQSELSHIIYSNLLEGPKAGRFVLQRVSPPLDLDYLTMIYQMRRFLYGGLSEQKLRHYLSRGVPVVHYKGFMSYCPLVDDDAQLRKLDGWLLHTVWTSLRARSAILGSLGVQQLPDPHQLSKRQLLRLQAVTFSGYTADLTLPSFFRIARMFRKAIHQFGPNAVAHPLSGQYYIG